MITSDSFEAWTAVASACDVVTRCIVHALTQLFATITKCSWRALLLTLFACESRPARALPSDVVTVGSVLALAHIGTVLSIKSSWATLSAVEPRPTMGTSTFSIVGAAQCSVVAVA